MAHVLVIEKDRNIISEAFEGDSIGLFCKKVLSVRRRIAILVKWVVDTIIGKFTEFRQFFGKELDVKLLVLNNPGQKGSNKGILNPLDMSLILLDGLKFGLDIRTQLGTRVEVVIGDILRGPGLLSAIVIAG
jgi:hypothetical protein